MPKDYEKIGVMKAPSEFDYSDTLQIGKPHHIKFDDFYRNHPFMDVSKRAKIFAPFAALKGFDGEISDREIQYQPKIIPDDETQDEINSILSELKNLTPNSRAARINSVTIKATYFVPCSDKNHEAYGYRGQYVTATGICMKVDDVITQTITVGDYSIPLDDILSIDLIEE